MRLYCRKWAECVWKWGKSV